MAIIRCSEWVTTLQFMQSYAYVQSVLMVIAVADVGTNYQLARAFVWECTTAGTTDAVNPTWPAAVTADVTTVTSGTAVFTARNPGYSSGTTVDWTFATPYFVYAVAAARFNGDFIYVDSDHAENFTADTTITFTMNVAVLSVYPGTGEPTFGASIGHSSTNRSITIAGAGRVYFWGMTFRTAGSSADNLVLGGTTSGGHYEFENCYIQHGNTGTTSTISLGGATEASGYIKFKNCRFLLGHILQSILIGDYRVVMEGCYFDESSKAPTTLFTFTEQGPPITIEGCDFSALGGISKTIFGNANTGARVVNVINSRLHPATVITTQTVANKGSLSVNLYNCSTGDAHYQFAHYDAFGSTVAQTEITANDGAKYNNVQRVAWKINPAQITGTVNLPYVSPWIDVPHEGGAAITPYVEGIYIGTFSSVKSNEFWAEWQYQGNADSPCSVFVNDRSVITAAQAAGMGLTSWSYGNLYPDSSQVPGDDFKVAPTSVITPRRQGMLRVRFYAIEKVTNGYYVIDPKVRGLT